MSRQRLRSAYEDQLKLKEWLKKKKGVCCRASWRGWASARSRPGILTRLSHIHASVMLAARADKPRPRGVTATIIHPHGRMIPTRRIFDII
jgi:hypothetical protein